METKKCECGHKIHTGSLNRTMQYGNGGLTKEKNNQKNKFKSYYVVWKLEYFVNKNKYINRV